MPIIKPKAIGPGHYPDSLHSNAIKTAVSCNRDAKLRTEAMNLCTIKKRDALAKVRLIAFTCELDLLISYKKDRQEEEEKERVEIGKRLEEMRRLEKVISEEKVEPSRRQNKFLEALDETVSYDEWFDRLERQVMTAAEAFES